MDEKKKTSAEISVVIKLNTKTVLFDEELKRSVDNIKGSGNPKTKVILACEEADSDVIAMCENALGSMMNKVKVVSYDALSDIKLSKYIIFIKQGNTFEKDSLTKALKTIKTTKQGIVFLGVKPPKKKTPVRQYSVFEDKFNGRLSAYGILMSRKLTDDPAVLLQDDIEAVNEISCVILRNGGYAVDRNCALNIEKNKLESDKSLVPGFAEKINSTSTELYGELVEFAEFVLGDVLSWNIDMHKSKAEALKAVELMSEGAIIANTTLSVRQKIYLLSIKYGRDILQDIVISDEGTATLNGVNFFAVNKGARFRINVVDIKGDTLVIDGTTDLDMLGDRYRIYFCNRDDERIPVEPIPFAVKDIAGFDDELIYSGMRYRVELPLKENDEYDIILEEDGLREISIIPKLDAYSRLNDDCDMSYFVKGGYLIEYSDNLFKVRKHTAGKRFRTEARYLWKLLKQKKATIVLYRLIYFIDRIFQRKPVWIVADRPHVAKDNGEHMFRYLMETEEASRNDIYFLLNKTSPDYERLKEAGKVLAYDSLKHKIKFLESSIIIAAAANNLAINAFGKNGNNYRDLYDYDFVYLRHGVAHNDQSRWINKLNKNMRVLVATCRPEYNGILNGAYVYTDREVKLTGLPRFDNLYDEAEKKIVILPTWRKNLEGELIPRSSKRAYIDDFKGSDYYLFYNSLINDRRLLDTMKEYGYTGEFYLHPVFEAQYDDFSSNEIIHIGKGVADYQKVFRECALMVTDFSSVAFDFAYLKKPVIYSQFDEEEFYRNHSWGKGYFTYREDGFGPITTTLDDTVNTLIDYIKNDCKMKPEYIEKVDRFFAYTDRNNRSRVYDAIKEIVDERNGK